MIGGARVDPKRLAVASLAFAITVLLLSAGAMGSGGDKETTAYYNGPLGDVSWHTPMCEPLLAQACFTLPNDVSTVTITIQDESGLPVSFWVDGANTGCGSLELSGLQAGSTIHVTANGPAYGALECGSTTATIGSITVATH